ncbi:RagB/SusD family nutrient uptake outer membrane protein [Myroides sp. N17-2]|uniref:RagB/SusD family nutrient uptake outer membrane protein n=1 Tax=Myroides sp. N17-2 TaxID=2030799 RepID=UPI000EFD1E50|nr:RagB/SusD family nutrient uptake outer membrane protein [Myroides sp. N17-2]
MRKILFLKLFALLAILTLSCENMIEVDLPNSQVNREDVFKDLSTTKAALSSIYTNARESQFLSKRANGIHYTLSLYTDELTYLGSATNNFYNNSLQGDSKEVSLWWNDVYRHIYVINAFIEGLSQSNYIDKTIKQQLLGEAITLRALHYHYLVQLYGDTPFTRSTDYNSNKTISRKPYAEVLFEIEQDLTQAISLLSDQYRDSKRFYINKAVAELLLAENYLLQGKFDLAQLYSQKIVDNNLYQIEKDLSKTFKKTSKGTIWQISPELETNITYEAELYIFNDLADNTSVVSDQLLSSFTDTDLRKKHWLRQINSKGKSLYTVYKYKNKTNNTDEHSIFFRIEQAYFILAESLLKQNKIPQAAQVLNEIKTSRGITPVSPNVSSADMTSELIQESSKEFFTELGQRFFLLKRFNKLDQLRVNKPNWETYHNLFPIPERQLQINKNLNPQNDGY